MSGDLSSLIDGDTSVLTIEARPVEGEETGLIRGTSDIYLPADQNDYELTPVTIDKQAGQATFEIRAVEDSDYDPLESVLLELVSYSDDVQVVSPNSLKLKIGDNDPRPFVSFSSTIGTQRLNWEYVNSNIPGSSVLEGEQRDFRVVIDRKSNRDVEFFIAFSGRPHLFSNGNEKLEIPSDVNWNGWRVITGQGYQWGIPDEWSLLRIPAGELGLTFTVNMESVDNDIYDYYWDRVISFGYIYVDKDHYAYTDRIAARHNFFITQDEPVPQLLLKSSAADDDGDASITVSEGDSFDIWVDISHQLGTSALFDEPDLNLRAKLVATTVSGAVLNLDLPDVLIGAYQSGVTVTVQIPADSLSNGGERTVILRLEDVIKTNRGIDEIPARLPNRLVVTILDDESPVVVPPATEVTITATLERSLFTLNEGQAATFRIDLDGDLSSLVDGDTTTLAIKDTPFRGGERSQSYEGYSYNYLAADRNDYELTPVTINKQTRQATFGVRAIDEDEFDPLESVRLEVVSRSDDIRVVATNSLRLNIFGNDRRPFISFTSTLTTVRNIDGANTIKIAEGDKGTFGVVLDRKSNRSVEVHIYSNGDFRPFFDANGVDPIRYARTHVGRRYFEDMGFWPGNRSWDDVIGPGPLVIPAGELGLNFTVDTTLLENDLYDYIDEDYFGTVYLKMNHPVYAYTDEASSRVHFRVVQDEPTPELSFRSADDGDATITVREGESFEVGIDIDPELGRYHRVWNSLLPGISLASQLTATAVTGDVPAWELPEIEIVPGQPGVTVTVQVPADSLSNGERTVVLDFEDALLSYTRSHLTSPARIKNSLIVTILDAEPPVEETITATLSTSSLTLEEGRVATITVDLGGDLSSLVNSDDTILTIEASPVEDEETGLIHGTSDIYLPAEQNDYELTLVTIDKQAGQATFEIRAVDDSDYDPLESVMLELVSHSDDIEIGSPNSLKLKIGDNDPRPFVSFSSTIGTQRLHWEYVNSDIPGSSVPEGEQGDFRVVIDRKSNRDVEFFIAFSGRPHLFSNDNEELVLPSDYIWIHGYLTEQGYLPGNPLNEWSLLRIPAGELGTTFTVDTRSAENDIYDYYWDRTISFGWLYVDKYHYAYTDRIGSRHNFFIAQDEPVPQLLLKSSAADDDGDASITVSEGDSFDIWVDISHQLGTSALFDEPDLNLRAKLVATTVSDAVLNLDLPDVLIGPYQSGVTVTVQIPADSLSNGGERTVILSLEDVAMTGRDPSIAFVNEISVRVPNRLVVTILDEEPPLVVPPATEVTITATLERSLFTLNEGRVATIQIDLDGDLSSLVDGDTTTLAIKDSPVGYPEWGTVFGNGETTLPAERNDYELTPVTINKLTRQATFEVRAVDDSDFDPLENVKLEVVSLSDDVNIISTNSLKLTIGDNDPQPFVSFATTLPASRDADGQLNVRLFEGETGTFRVVLDRKSNRAVQIYVYSDEPSTPYDRFFDETGVNPIRHSSQHGNKYITDRGYRPGQYSTVGSRPILIPAGEWGLTFTADTRSFANDLYDYIESDYFGQVFLEVRQRKYAFEAYGYTDKASSRINFITVQDEPIPELSFQSDADGDATITAREGESFDVRIDIDPPPGEYFRASALNNALPGVSLVSQLAATAVIGEIPAWGLPDVKIVPGQSGVTATVWVPVDGLANGTRTVTLDFEGAILHYTSGDRTIPARIKNSLIVTILDNDPTTPVTDEPPVVAVQFTDLINFDGIDYEKYLYEGWERSLTVELINAPPGGAHHDTTVHLATGSDSTVSESDYSYPSSVTIPRGRSSVEFTVRSIDDTQVEPRETLNIYASSVDYGGQSYEQSDPGVDLTIFNDDELGHPSIEVIGDRNQILGATVTLQVTLREVLAENLPARSFMIGFSRNWAQAIDLTEDLKHSTTTYVSVNAKDHPALGKVGWVEFYYTTVIFDHGYIYGGGPSRQWLRWQGLINVIDPAELPIVTINSVHRTEPAEVITGNSLSEPPFSELRRPIPFNDLVTVREGDTVQLELELISVPEGSMADTMTVHLITKNITTSESDYRVPSIVTIPRGQSRVTFEVNALQDSLGEDDESLYIYARTVSFGGQSYRQLYSRPNLSIAVTIVDDEEQLPIALQYVNDQSVVFEGESALLEVVLPDLPEGGLVDTMTVRLATGNKTTASSSDYSYPSTVTIPRGESRATFVVRARQDSWRERDETLNIYVSQFDYRGENYERAGLGVDLTIANNSDVIPIVTIRPHHPAFDSVSEGGRNTLKLGVTNIPSPRGADRDITVYLKTRNITASDYDYTYQSVITIPRGQNFKWAYVRGVDDNLLENHEYFEIYVSSIDYGGQNYEQSDTGTRLELRSNDRVQESLKVLGGADQAKGTTVTVRLELNYPLPAGVPDNTVRLAFFLTGSTRAVDATVYGQQFVLGLSEWETYLTIPTEAFQGSTIVDIPFYLADDGLAAEPGLEIRIRSIVYPRGAVQVSRNRARTFFRIIDNDEPPVVSIRSLSDTSTSLTSTSSVRRSDLNSVNEGDMVQLEVELTNAPEGGMAEDITVHLATENSSAVSRSDYSYPSSVTIPRGQSRVTFEVRALQDDLVEDDEILNIYVSSVDYGGQSYEQSDTGVDLTIVDVDNNEPPVVSIRSLSGVEVLEGDTLTLEVELTNAPEGGTTEDITVNLASGSSSVASRDDYSYPSSVTIPQGQSRVTFEVSVNEDNWMEGKETLNIYVNSVEYLGQHYEQSGLSIDLTIINTTIIGSFARERLPFAVYPFSQTVIAEGESALMVVELLDVQGEQDEVVTVFLENGLDASTSASQFDFSFPEVVTIPRGQTWVTFEVKAISDNLAEYDETLKIGVSQAYYRGYRYSTTTQSTSMRISYENDPIVKIQLKPSSWENSAIAPEGAYAPLEVVVINPPDEGLEDHIIVHLATRDITTSESDYEYLSSVTIQWIDTKRNASVWVFRDGLVEYDEMFNIYVTSVDYDGRNYEQSDAGTDVTIKDGDKQLGLNLNLVTDTSTTSLSDLGKVVEGESVLFEVELLELALPSASENGADRDLTLHLVTGSVTTASYSDYSLPSSITIPDGENRVTFEVRAIQDDLVEDSETLTFGLWSAEYGGVSYQFRKRAWESLTIVDNEEPPVVSIRSLRRAEPAEVSNTEVDEGDTVSLVVELTNAPEGGAPEDITVNLATGNGATASESDYSYPRSVTIPQGQSRVTFEVSALQDDLVEDDETLNIYVSSVDYNGHNYEQSDTGADLTIVDVDFNDPPIVSVRRHGANFGVGEGTSASLIAELIPAPQYGTDRDITVHLAIGSWSTASETDYSYPSSVTIPRGQSFVRFDVQALNDDLPEYPETLNVHVSSVDYAGRNYVQSRGGVDLRIISDDRIEPVITVLGGVDHPEGSTVTVRIAVSQVLPADIPVNAITLSVSLSDSIRSVSVDGRSLGSEQSRVLYLVNALKASTSVDVVFSLTDDYIAGPDGFVKLRIDSYDSLLLSGAQSYFRIVDNDEPPVVVVPDPIVTIRSLSEVEVTTVNEGDTVQLVAELTNAPEGGAAEDITVFLAARAGGTAKPEDIDFPASVTIAAGDSSVRFPVSATADSLVEYDEKINIYAASVEYGDSSSTLSDSGYDLTITVPIG